MRQKKVKRIKKTLYSVLGRTPTRQEWHDYAKYGVIPSIKKSLKQSIEIRKISEPITDIKSIPKLKWWQKIWRLLKKIFRK